MYRYDFVIQLGSQVKHFPKQPPALLEEPVYGNPKEHYELAPHTRMRTEASALVLEKGIAKRLIISGGSNFGVRYNDHELLNPPVFTFEAFADSDSRKSEAAVIKDVLVNEFGIPSRQILAEPLAATTEENAEIVKIMLRRRPAFTGNEKIAILTLLYHMEKALPVFRKAGLNVEPLFAENVLANADPSQIDRICQYYSTPKGGKQYPVDRIRQLLTQSKSLEELIQ